MRKEGIGHCLDEVIKNGWLTREDGVKMSKEIVESHLRTWKQIFESGESYGMVMGQEDADIQGALFNLETLERASNELVLDLQTKIDEAREALYRRFPRARNLQPIRLFK